MLGREEPDAARVCRGLRRTAAAQDASGFAATAHLLREAASALRDYAEVEDAVQRESDENYGALEAIVDVLRRHGVIPPATDEPFGVEPAPPSIEGAPESAPPEDKRADLRSAELRGPGSQSSGGADHFWRYTSDAATDDRSREKHTWGEAASHPCTEPEPEVTDEAHHWPDLRTRVEAIVCAAPQTHKIGPAPHYLCDRPNDHEGDHQAHVDGVLRAQWPAQPDRGEG